MMMLKPKKPKNTQKLKILGNRPKIKESPKPINGPKLKHEKALY